MFYKNVQKQPLFKLTTSKEKIQIHVFDEIKKYFVTVFNKAINFKEFLKQRLNAQKCVSIAVVPVAVLLCLFHVSVVPNHFKK